MHSHQKQILVVTAVPKEQEAIRNGLGDSQHIDVVAAGVGSIVTAVHTVEALSRKRYHLVLNMGIGGGFANRSNIGSIVVGTEIVAADFGVEAPNGFRFVDELGLGTSRIQSDEKIRKQLTSAFRLAALPVVTGPILTVSTVTGTAETSQEMLKRIPDATAEAMEGFGVATAAQKFRVPMAEIRTISNLVGPRNRSAWQIEDALRDLTEVSKVLREVLL